MQITAHVGSALLCGGMAGFVCRARFAASRMGTRVVFGAHVAARSPHASGCAIISVRKASGCFPLGAAVELVSQDRQSRQDQINQSSLENRHDPARSMDRSRDCTLDVAHPTTL